MLRETEPGLMGLCQAASRHQINQSPKLAAQGHPACIRVSSRASAGAEATPAAIAAPSGTSARTPLGPCGARALPSAPLRGPPLALHGVLPRMPAGALAGIILLAGCPSCALALCSLRLPLCCLSLQCLWLHPAAAPPISGVPRPRETSVTCDNAPCASGRGLACAMQRPAALDDCCLVHCMEQQMIRCLGANQMGFLHL